MGKDRKDLDKMSDEELDEVSEEIVNDWLNGEDNP